MDHQRVIDLCKVFGGKWEKDEISSGVFDLCFTDSFRVSIGPIAKLVEVSGIMKGSEQRQVFHKGQTEPALEMIRLIHAEWIVRTQRFKALVETISEYVHERGVAATPETSGDYCTFKLDDIELFRLLDQPEKTWVEIGGNHYEVSDRASFIAAVTKSADDIPPPYTHQKNKDTVYIYGAWSALLAHMLIYGVERFSAHTANQWPTSPDKVLNILLGNVKPKRSTYYELQFADVVPQNAWAEICKS